MSPVCAPEMAGWQSCAPMETGVPLAIALNRAMSVAGGQIIKSTARASGAARVTIASISPAELDSPFIFQLPATSGRRAEEAIDRVPHHDPALRLAAAHHPALRLADRAWWRQSAAGDPTDVAGPCGPA